MDIEDPCLVRLIELFRRRRFYLIVLSRGQDFVAKALCVGDYTRDCFAVGPTPIGAAETLARQLGIDDEASRAPPVQSSPRAR